MRRERRDRLGFANATPQSLTRLGTDRLTSENVVYMGCGGK